MNATSQNLIISRRSVVAAGISTPLLLNGTNSYAWAPAWALVSLALRSLFQNAVRIGARRSMNAILKRPIIGSGGWSFASAQKRILKSKAYRESPSFFDELIAAVGAELVLEAMQSVGAVWVAEDKNEKVNRFDSAIQYRGKETFCPVLVSPTLVDYRTGQKVGALRTLPINLRHGELFDWSDCIANIPYTGTYNVRLEIEARDQSQHGTVNLSPAKPVTILPAIIT